MLAKRCCSSTARSAEARISILWQSVSVAFEPGELKFVDTSRHAHWHRILRYQNQPKSSVAFSSSNQAEMLLLDSSRHATYAQHVAKRCCSSTARSAEARISILCSSAVSVSFEPGELVKLRCCSVCRHKSPCMPCTLALSFATRINRKVRFLHQTRLRCWLLDSKSPSPCSVCTTCTEFLLAQARPTMPCISTS